MDKRVSGRYRLIEPIGEGGMGVVWRAYDEVLDRTVAIKEVRYTGVDEARRAELNRRTIREARAAGRLDHPSVVVVHDVVEEDGRPWIVMQLVRSRSLAQVVRESGPLRAGQVGVIGDRVLDALRAAHATGVLHRDVKPENVLLADDGRVVLTDFGIASMETETGLTATGGLVGTPAYMPPERLNGEPARPESDLWSLGATLYTAVEGRPPYKGDSWAATVAAVLRDEPRPPVRAGALTPVIMGLLHRSPAARMPADQAARLLR
ncbi:serine/threonine protein kinase, partial [Nonomuraea terrae]